MFTKKTIAKNIMTELPDLYRHNEPRTSIKGLWFITLAVFSLLYLATCQRGVSWQDSGMFQWRVLEGDYSGELGLALAHPLYIAAGKLLELIPVGSFTLRLNFFSGLGMAVALANLSAVIALVSNRRWIGFATAVMLGVCHTVWWLSTVAEVYTWSAAGLTAEIWIVVLLLIKPSWQKLALLAFISGLGLCIHNFALLPLPVYLVLATVLIVRKKLPVWSLAAAAGCYLLGSGLYIAMIIELAVRSGSLVGAIGSALFGDYQAKVINVADTSKHFKANITLAGLNFVNFLLPLAIVGWVSMKRRIGIGLTATLIAITFIEFLFVLRYPVPDQFTFLLPTLAMFALAAGVGVWHLAEMGKKWRRVAIIACLLSIAMPPIFYAVGPALVRCAKLEPERQRQLPFRDELNYWLVPWKHNENSAELFASAALEQARPEGVIIADSTSLFPLLLVNDRDNIAPKVQIVQNDKAEEKYSADPATFRKELGLQKLFIVAPEPGHAPEGILAECTFSRSEDEVLYNAVWP